jgi:hypothetical protein
MGLDGIDGQMHVLESIYVYTDDKDRWGELCLQRRRGSACMFCQARSVKTCSYKRIHWLAWDKGGLVAAVLSLKTEHINASYTDGQQSQDRT